MGRTYICTIVILLTNEYNIVFNLFSFNNVLQLSVEMSFIYFFRFVPGQPMIFDVTMVLREDAYDFLNKKHLLFDCLWYIEMYLFFVLNLQPEILLNLLFFFFFLVVLGLVLIRETLYHLNHTPPAFFGFSSFSDRVPHLCQGWPG